MTAAALILTTFSVLLLLADHPVLAVIFICWAVSEL